MKKIISKLDTFFHLDTKKILGQASYLFGGQMFGNILSFAVALAAAHFISKDTYGTYRYILSIVSFIGAFSLTGLSTAIVRSVARGYDGIFTRSFGRSLLWSLPAFIVGIGSGIWYVAHGNMTLGISVLVGGIVFPFVQALLWYKSYLNGKKYFRALMKSNIAYSLVTSGTILIILVFHPSVITLIVGYYASNIVITGILAIVIRRKFHPNNLPDPDGDTLEKHMSLINVLDSGAAQLDKIILFQVAGPIEVARYTFATLIPEQLRSILKYIPTLSMPTFSSLPPETARAKGLFLVKKLFLITIPLVVVYIFIAPLVYTILFPTYNEVVLYSQIFALILLFDGGISGTLLKAQHRVKELYWVNISSNGIKIILLLVLGFFWGIWGIIASRIISRIFSFIFSYILVQRIRA